MKVRLGRTKVVLRHLPPAITQSMLMEQVDSGFAGRYNWLCFRPGKSRQKYQSYSRAYINFNKPEDVIEFAEFFDGHIFVNERGTQFKAIIEYAPSQRVPKQWSKKDGREGTILEDPEYLEFLEFLAKPVECLPSAEIQLEKKEAERAGTARDAPIVTPLMNYVRQRRAAKSGARRSVSNGKPTKRASGVSTGSPSSGLSKRGSEKRKASTMYVLRDSTKCMSGKEKSTYVVVSQEEDQQLSDKSVIIAAASEPDSFGVEKGGSGSTEMGKKKILLLKGKEKEIPNVSGGLSVQKSVASVKHSPNSSFPKQSQQREASGRIIRSILLKKDSRQNQSSFAVQSEQKLLINRGKRPSSLSGETFSKDTNGPEDKVVGNDPHIVHIGKQEKHTRNRDRPDGVWSPLRHSDGSHASDESLSSSSCQPNQVLDSVEGVSGEMKGNMPSGRGSDSRSTGSRCSSHSYVDSGCHTRGGWRHNMKGAEGSSITEGKPLRKGYSGYGSHEVCCPEINFPNFACDFLFNSRIQTFFQMSVYDVHAETNVGAKVEFWFLILLYM